MATIQIKGNGIYDDLSYDIFDIANVSGTKGVSVFGNNDSIQMTGSSNGAISFDYASSPLLPSPYNNDTLP